MPERPLRIALLATPRHPIAEPYAGGLEAHTHQLARGLREAGHDVTLFAHPGSDPAIPMVANPGPSVNFIHRTWLVSRALRRIATGEFDVLHDNSISFLPPLLSRRLPFPVVTTLHTPPYRSHRFTAGRARDIPNHTYVSISRHLASVWSPLVGAVPVVHNGIALDSFPFAPARRRPKTAVWYGRIHPSKGPHFAALACREAGFSLTLAGTIEDEHYFREHVKPLLNASIRYVGHVGQRELAELIGAASVGLVTSVWEEPFGLVAAEMLACGTPVAAFNSGALAEILTPDCSVLVERGDWATLAQVLSEVESKDRGHARGRAEKFSLKAMTGHYLDVYTRLLDHNY